MNNQELLNYIRFLRERLNRDKLIIFVGAGVSCNVKGMPDWNGLIRNMADAIGYSKCDSFSTDEYLKIPQYVFNKSEELYNQIIFSSIKNMNVDASLANIIVDLNPAHIITTNYDNLIENCKSIKRDNYDVIINDKDLLTTKKKRYIIKMHGDISYPETIVLKETDYLEYSQKHVLIEMFVKALFADHTILFLGYSLNDYNIKLIISWINYIRMQNTTLDSEMKFAYIVLDDPQITEMQVKYFENNGIGVINLYEMPLLEYIPGDISKEIGRRLYSFLKIVEDASLEIYMGNDLLYDEAVKFMRDYRFVDCQNICKLLCLGSYDFNSYELVLSSDENYLALAYYLVTSSENAEYLKQILVNVGIVRFRSVKSFRRFDLYEIEGYRKAMLDNRFYQLYLSNDYIALNTLANASAKDEVFEAAFYKSIVENYSETVVNWYSEIDYDSLSIEKKVCYLFNCGILRAQYTWRYDGRGLAEYINGIADSRQRDMFEFYLNILNGNLPKLFTMQKCLNKLKRQNRNNDNDMVELYDIRSIAMEQYWFYFYNTLFFAEYTDLNRFLKFYIEAIVCTNEYPISPIDFDIMTKFISTKELYDMIDEHKVKMFRTPRFVVDKMIECFENIIKSINELQLFNNKYNASEILMNCILILTHVPLDENGMSRIDNTIDNLMKGESFAKISFHLIDLDKRFFTQLIEDLLKYIHHK